MDVCVDFDVSFSFPLAKNFFPLKRARTSTQTLEDDDDAKFTDDE